MELTSLEIMVAKTYDQDKNFDLSVEYDLLIDDPDSDNDLHFAGYDTIPSSTMLQCIAAGLITDITRKSIQKLEKSSVINIWPEIKDSIFHAVDYCRNYYRIPVSRLLPHPALLVPFVISF